MHSIPLEFHGDAICLSGELGTKLKCEILGSYYPFWWDIVSGGLQKNHNIPTSIIELNAGTGEVFIKDTGETLLGSAGHAMQLKMRNQYETRNLKLILIEEDVECFSHLKNVIQRRWPKLPSVIAENNHFQIRNDIFLLNVTIDKVLAELEDINLGMALYFFDPLLFITWDTIEKVANNRIKTPFKTGTEFIIFLFTSDWFLGRGDFAPLPTNMEENSWDESQKKTVHECDRLLGNVKWRDTLLRDESIEKRQNLLIKIYQSQLLKWFRYVLPLPFKPKPGQLYHLIFCSNFETGIRATNGFYINKTMNPKYAPDNKRAYSIFKKMHPETLKGLRGNQRPEEWKILWTIIREHQGGICDPECRSLKTKVNYPNQVYSSLDWLTANNYVLPLSNIEWAWPEYQELPRYEVNWKKVNVIFGIKPPPPLVPIEKNSSLTQ